MRALLPGLTAAVALSVVTPASAQDPTRADLEGAMIQMFASEPVTIINFRGEEGDPGHWYMIREVTGARVTADCHLQLETTTLEASPNVTPAAHYRFAWADVSDVDHEDDFVTWDAGHMAEDEIGGMVFESEELAEMVWAVMQFMVDDCSAA